MDKPETSAEQLFGEALELHYVPEGNYILRAAAGALPEFPREHQCPPDCQPSPPPTFGAFAEVPLVVTGEIIHLIVTVQPPPGATP